MKLRYSYVEGGKHPLLGQIFYKLRNAIGSGNALRYQRYICDVLGAVAQTLDECNRLLECIEKIEKAECGEIETGGNDVTLKMRNSGVQVDIEINEEWIGKTEGHFTLEEWRKALIGWHQFLEMPESLESVVEVEM